MYTLSPTVHTSNKRHFYFVHFQGQIFTTVASYFQVVDFAKGQIGSNPDKWNNREATKVVQVYNAADEEELAAFFEIVNRNAVNNATGTNDNTNAPPPAVDNSVSGPSGLPAAPGAINVTNNTDAPTAAIDGASTGDNVPPTAPGAPVLAMATAGTTDVNAPTPAIGISGGAEGLLAAHVATVSALPTGIATGDHVPPTAPGAPVLAMATAGTADVNAPPPAIGISGGAEGLLAAHVATVNALPTGIATTNNNAANPAVNPAIGTMGGTNGPLAAIDDDDDGEDEMPALEPTITGTTTTTIIRLEYQGRGGPHLHTQLYSISMM